THSAASIVPFSKAGKMSPAASCCGTTPSFAKIRPANPPTRNFKPHVVETFDLLAEPAAHLACRVAGRHPPAIVGLEEVVHQLNPATVELPGLLLTRVEPKGQSRAEGESGILAEIVIGRGMAHLDRAVLHGVQHLQAGHDLARGEHLNLKPVLAELGNP